MKFYGNKKTCRRNLCFFFFWNKHRDAGWENGNGREGKKLTVDLAHGLEPLPTKAAGEESGRKSKPLPPSGGGTGALCPSIRILVKLGSVAGGIVKSPTGK